jgi:hypothetical protein
MGLTINIGVHIGKVHKGSNVNPSPPGDITTATCDTTLFTCDNGTEITVDGEATTVREQFDNINDMMTIFYTNL